MLACRNSGQFFVISTTREAYEFLTSKWPVSEGKHFLAALQICSEAFGAADTELARSVFVAAAEEAGIPASLIEPAAKTG